MVMPEVEVGRNQSSELTSLRGYDPGPCRGEAGVWAQGWTLPGSLDVVRPVPFQIFGIEYDQMLCASKFGNIRNQQTTLHLYAGCP